MVELDLEPYCDNCSDLYPVVERLYADGTIYNHITCEHISHCRRVVDFYQKNATKGENDGM